MALKKIKKPHLLEAIFNPIVDPRGVMNRLISQHENPPYTPTVAILFLGLCFAPVLFKAASTFGETDIEQVACVTLTTASTLIITGLLLPFLTYAVSGRKCRTKVLAALAYASTPVTAVMAVLLPINLIVQGNVTVLTFIANGTSLPGDLFLQVFPWAFRASLILGFLTLAFGLSTSVRAHLGTGLVLSAFTICILLGSFIIALHITDLILPETSSRTIDFFARYFASAHTK